MPSLDPTDLSSPPHLVPASSHLFFLLFGRPVSTRAPTHVDIRHLGRTPLVATRAPAPSRVCRAGVSCGHGMVSGLKMHFVRQFSVTPKIGPGFVFRGSLDPSSRVVAAEGLSSSCLHRRFLFQKLPNCCSHRLQMEPQICGLFGGAVFGTGILLECLFFLPCPPWLPCPAEQKR